MGAFFGVTTIMIVFFMPETAYHRDATGFDVTSGTQKVEMLSNI
jgi:hypothetical protein